MMDGELVLADRQAVEEIAARAAAANRVALDTEFFWERTYAPQLCLVQVAVDEHVALVDPLEGAPLEPIAELVADPNVEVVMHAPAGDLLAFGLRYGVKPTRVVDTQLLAGFVGLTALRQPRPARRRRAQDAAAPRRELLRLAPAAADARAVPLRRRRRPLPASRSSTASSSGSTSAAAARGPRPR